MGKGYVIINIKCHPFWESDFKRRVHFRNATTELGA